MNDKEYAKQKKRCQRIFDKWHAPLGMLWWKVTYEWHRGAFESNGESNANVLADIDSDWKYCHAFIRINLDVASRMDDEYLERSLVHECIHALVNEMRVQGIDHEERVVSTLSHAFLWVRDAAKKGTI